MLSKGDDSVKIYLRAVMRLLLCLLLSFLLIFIVTPFMRTVYSELNMHFKEIFPIYSPITDNEKYLEFEKNISVLSAGTVFFVFSFVTTVFDNERYEHMIKLTDGFYTLKNGVRIYIKRYAAADIISSAIAPLPIFLMTLIKFPKTDIRFLLTFEEWLGEFLTCPHAFINKFGFIYGYVIAAAVILMAKIPAAVTGLKRWRGLWLSDVEN